MKLLALTLLAAGCALDPATDPATATTASAVTTDDVDFAPECAGIIGYTNWASYNELNYALPSNIANAIIARRNITPFVSIADISSVPGIAQARLATITGRAYTLDWIDVECSGVYEELAVSYDDRAAILGFVNTASLGQLADVARYQHDTVAGQIIASRPYTTLQQLVDVHGVGPSSFRAIRDAATQGPFDLLAAQVESIDRDVFIKTAFDWFSVIYDQPGYTTLNTCFGLSPSIASAVGATLRPTLADGPEVVDAVANAVSYADRYHELTDTGPGLADLAANTAGQSFFGCYVHLRTSPWSGIQRAWFVNTLTGYRVSSEIFWSE